MKSLCLFIVLLEKTEQVITAVVLKAFKISNDIITKEYLLSEGVDDPRLIKNALSGFGEINNYLKSDNCKLIKEKLCG